MTEIMLFQPGEDPLKLADKLEIFAEGLLQVHKDYIHLIHGFYLERAVKDIRGAASSLRKRSG